MKQEFNFQSLNYARTALHAAALALPAIWMSVQHYGWAGMLVAGVFTAQFSWRRGITTYEMLSRARYARDEYDRHPTHTIPEQAIGDDVAKAFGMPRVPIYVDTFQDNLACTDRHSIYIAPGVAGRLTASQTAYVIAHEMDHIRHTADEYLHIPLIEGAKISGVMGGIAVVGTVTSAVPLPNNPGVLATMAVSAGAALLLTLSARAVQRAVELRCDSNALRATGDMQSAVDTTEILGHMGDPLPPDTILGKAMRAIAYPLLHHPSTATRLQNLENTWAAMQSEKKAAQARATHDPSMRP